MINWIVANHNKTFTGWAFPSFEIQEYLIPIINVGVERFNMYGRTEYSADDCRRLTNVVSFAIETLQLMDKVEFQFETINDGTAVLNKHEIEATLRALLQANDVAIQSSGTLVFLGD